MGGRSTHTPSKCPGLNALVVTVGKSWSSIHSDMLSDGDPGATATLTPQVR